MARPVFSLSTVSEISLPPACYIDCHEREIHQRNISQQRIQRKQRNFAARHQTSQSAEADFAILSDRIFTCRSKPTGPLGDDSTPAKAAKFRIELSRRRDVPVRQLMAEMDIRPVTIT